MAWFMFTRKDNGVTGFVSDDSQDFAKITQADPNLLLTPIIRQPKDGEKYDPATKKVITIATGLPV